MLRDCFTAWTDIGKTIVYVGTETQASILRLAWAGVRCGVPVETAIDPQCPAAVMEKLLADVEAQTTGYLAQRAIFGDCKVATVAELGKWVRFAKKSNADALIFDHFGRMARSTGDKQWQQAGGDAKAIKNLAKDNELLIVMGAQLTQGEGGAWLGGDQRDPPGSGHRAPGVAALQAGDHGATEAGSQGRLHQGAGAGAAEHDGGAGGGTPMEGIEHEPVREAVRGAGPVA
jgi:hypothetical protein